MRLTDLPSELILQILQSVASLDLLALLRCQATNRMMQHLVLDVLRSTAQRRDHNHGTYEPVLPEYLINPLLWGNFKPLFNSKHCFNDEERRRPGFLTLAGDDTLPFRRLPWAVDAASRDAFLRPQASWRDISITTGRGPPITQVDVVKTLDDDTTTRSGFSTSFSQVDFGVSSDTSCLTMGLLYDLLLQEGSSWQQHMVRPDERGTESLKALKVCLGSWKLLPGRRLRSYDVLHEYECFVEEDDDLVDLGPGAAQAAILYLQAGTIDPDDFDDFDGPDAFDGSSDGHGAACSALLAGDFGVWKPEMLGTPAKLLLWQGPVHEHGSYT